MIPAPTGCYGIGSGIWHMNGFDRINLSPRRSL
jgi:hypothetical protein